MFQAFKRTLLPALVIATLALAADAAQAARYGIPTFTVTEVGKSVARVRVTAAPDGAVGGFRVQWMSKADFDALGGWPATEDYSLGVVFCRFEGAPTLNTLDGTTTFQLGPNASATIEVGDIFDETGMYANYDGDMQLDTQYILRGRAEGYGPILPSFWSPDIIYTTDSQTAGDCTYTQGYWKNHPNAWPTTTLTLGTVTYDQTQLLAIFNTPAAGNGLISLAHQLIAALLNEFNGASMPAPQQSAMFGAQSMIGSLVVPSVGTGFLSPSSTSAYTQTLDEYNNGITGPGHCGPLPV
ncbi:MAG: PT repeat-containing protein, partial [bacterium]